MKRNIGIEANIPGIIIAILPEIILSKVAECYELPIDQVSELIYQNSKEIFNDN